MKEKVKQVSGGRWLSRQGTPGRGGKGVVLGTFKDQKPGSVAGASESGGVGGEVAVEVENRELGASLIISSSSGR